MTLVDCVTGADRWGFVKLRRTINASWPRLEKKISFISFCCALLLCRARLCAAPV